MKRFIKHLILTIVLTVGLCALGTFAISIKENNIVKQNSYEFTEFSYVILNPSKNQIEEFKSDKEAVKAIFPVYNFSANMVGNNPNKINLLLSDQLQEYEIGLFNSKNIISGSFDESGIMLDQFAANKLGVKVGENVSTSLGHTNFTFEVKAIYLATNYRGFDSGVALANFSSAIKEAFGRELSYDYAFISTDNDAACKTLLKDYIPLGSLKSEAQFIKEAKESSTCPPGISDEEWTEALKQEYQTYKDEYLKRDYSDSIQDKSLLKQDVVDQVRNGEQRIILICVASIVGAIIVYSSLFIVFCFTNTNYDVLKHQEGERNIESKYIVSSILLSFLFAFLSAGFLSIIGMTKHFFTSYIGIIVCFSLPFIISLIIIIPVVGKVYFSKFKNKIKEIEKR